MQFTLPPLPYELSALEPFISARTLEYHHDKHLAAYINNLNTLIKGTEFEEGMPLEQIVLRSKGKIYNNAAQAWNHIFYFNQLSPKPKTRPEGKLAEAIDRDFGSFDAFKEEFVKQSLAFFGSGWVWLVADDEGHLSIVGMENAGNPATEGLRAVMTIDVWEHAYYLDAQNRRNEYITNFFNVLNWQFIEDNF